MKGKVKGRIPQRIYEFLEVDYYFENEEEKKEAFASAISDCVNYHHRVDKHAEVIPQNQP